MDDGCGWDMEARPGVMVLSMMPTPSRLTAGVVHVVGGTLEVELEAEALPVESDRGLQVPNDEEGADRNEVRGQFRLPLRARRAAQTRMRRARRCRSRAPAG